MNERILALAASHFPRDGEGNIHATPEIIGEFAELIVRECAERLLNDAKLTDIQTTRCVASIREHFGVEE